MPTVIDRQVEAFKASAGDFVSEIDHDELIAASKEAYSVHDMLLSGILVTRMISGHIADRKTDAAVGAEHWVELSDTINGVLREMIRVRRKAESFKDDHRKTANLAEFDECIVELRCGLACATDLQLPAQEREANHKIIQGLEYNNLIADPASALPPQEWFDEDFRHLREPTP